MTRRAAIKIMLALIAAVTLFHLLIVVKVIPYTLAWGGRLQNDGAMYVSESLSIVVNLFLGFVLLMKGEYIRLYFSPRMIHVILWVYLFLFVLNTLGNLFAATSFEKSLAVLAVAFAVLLWRVVRGR